MSTNQAKQLVLDYRPPEPTGWEGPAPGELGKTIGGHHSSKEFKLAGRNYRIGLLAFGQPDGSAGPVYESVPGDLTIAFRRTLERKFGAHYTFRDRGGLRGKSEFRVQSYSVFAKPGQMSFGAELYVVYEPQVHAGDPRAEKPLGWIQVARWTGAGGSGSAPYVDDGARTNPFLMTGGLTSIFGNPVFNFYNLITAQLQQSPASHSGLSASYLAEAFLARDTATRDRAGKDVIEIFGGLKYGWQLHEVKR